MNDTPVTHRVAMAGHFSVLAYANGFTWWLYQHPHSIADIFAESFWDDADIGIERGDLIYVIASDAAQMLTVISAGDQIRVTAQHNGAAWFPLPARDERRDA